MIRRVCFIFMFCMLAIGNAQDHRQVSKRLFRDSVLPFMHYGYIVRDTVEKVPLRQLNLQTIDFSLYGDSLLITVISRDTNTIILHNNHLRLFNAFQTEYYGEFYFGENLSKSYYSYKDSGIVRKLSLEEILKLDSGQKVLLNSGEVVRVESNVFPPVICLFNDSAGGFDNCFQYYNNKDLYQFDFSCNCYYGILNCYPPFTTFISFTKKKLLYSKYYIIKYRLYSEPVHFVIHYRRSRFSKRFRIKTQFIDIVPK